MIWIQSRKARKKDTISLQCNLVLGLREVLNTYNITDGEIQATITIDIIIIIISSEEY
jgi:hypothetical protein